MGLLAEQVIKFNLDSNMAKGDREHFNEYRQQTRIKHEILESYTRAYLHILKKYQKTLVFIDGFAGRGQYKDQDSGKVFDGSPLRAIKFVRSHEQLAAKTQLVFIELDDENYSELEMCVRQAAEGEPAIHEPLLFHASFADQVEELVSSIEDEGGDLAPTFLFVDPCGVEGTSMKAIARVMAFDRCEAFIFFNLAAVRRIMGLTSLGSTLPDLFGTKIRAEKAIAAANSAMSAHEKEQAIISHYVMALQEDLDAAYITPFRVESADRADVSHYLIHVTKHPLGFRIMKDVMWARGCKEDGTYALELTQASRVDGDMLIPLARSEIRKEIVRELEEGRRRVDHFCETIAGQAGNLIAPKGYKDELIAMESDGLIRVLEPESGNPCPASARQVRKGKATLAGKYIVELP